VNKCRTSDPPRSALHQSDRGRTCRITRRTRWMPRKRPGFGSGSRGKENVGKGIRRPAPGLWNGIAGGGCVASGDFGEVGQDEHAWTRWKSRRGRASVPAAGDVGKITLGHQTGDSGPQKWHCGGECGPRGGCWYLREARAAPGVYRWAECRARTQLDGVPEEIGARLRKGPRDYAACERVTKGDEG
jgi:hypothetical protein